MLVGQFGNVEIIVDEGGGGQEDGGTGRNDGCRRVHDLRDSRVKRAFPPHFFPGSDISGYVKYGFYAGYIKTSIVPFLFLNVYFGTRDVNIIYFPSFPLLLARRYLFLSPFSLRLFLPEVSPSTDLVVVNNVVICGRF